MRRIAATLVGALCVARAASAQAQPPPSGQAPPAQPPPHAASPRAAPPKGAGPDLEFLEYLGSWQGDDDEWLAIKEWDQDAAPKDAAGKPPAKPKEPVPQQAGSEHEKSP